MRTYVCGGESGTARSRDRRNDLAGCPNDLHDWPPPEGYTDAAVEAGWRLRNRWSNPRCPDCKRFGWRPGKLTELHIRRPADHPREDTP